MNRPDLFALVGQRVTVTHNPGGSITGTLVALTDQPSMILDLDDGSRVGRSQAGATVVLAADQLAETKPKARWERLAIREPNGDIAHTFPEVPPVGDVVVGARVHGWPDMRVVADNLARLDDMLTNLQAHIDERAAELAAPLIAEAQDAAAVEVKGARGLQQRAEDLNVELRRQLRALDRQCTNYRQRAELAEVAVGRALATMYRDADGSGPDLKGKSLDYQRGYQACAAQITQALNGTTFQEGNRS